MRQRTSTKLIEGGYAAEASVTRIERGQIRDDRFPLGGGDRDNLVIKTADWIIDLGPEGGDGEIVAAGTPEDVAKVKRSYTGQFLAPVLGQTTAVALAIWSHSPKLVE